MDRRAYQATNPLERGAWRATPWGGKDGGKVTRLSGCQCHQES